MRATQRPIISRLLTLTLLIGMGDAVCSNAQLPEAEESQIRAMMIIHLTKFVDWPAQRSDPHSSFSICIVDNDQIGANLEMLLANKLIKGRSVLIRRGVSLDQADQCHILYWAHPKHNILNSYSTAWINASVLTVSEETHARSGLMIGLPLEDGHVMIEIDRSMAQRGNLTLSSRLLQIAAESRR
jgi:hypothetical protein